MVVIRLARHGAKKRPFYKVVVADRRSPRDGAFLEAVGFFNPLTETPDLRLKLNVERLEYWRGCGAQMSDRVKSLMRELNRQNKTQA